LVAVALIVRIIDLQATEAQHHSDHIYLHQVVMEPMLTIAIPVDEAVLVLALTLICGVVQVLVMLMVLVLAR
jgi:hypothetical protein